MFYCFGCHEGGNVFTFVMKIEKVSFIEAVRSLAEKAGITLPTTESDTTAETENEQLYRANLLAARFFYESLTQTTEGEFALNYFRKRGFSDETMKQFGLGYAPRGWQSFLNHAKERVFQKRMSKKPDWPHAATTAVTTTASGDEPCFQYSRQRVVWWHLPDVSYMTTTRLPNISILRRHRYTIRENYCTVSPLRGIIYAGRSMPYLWRDIPT
jgi:DNA primase catalytic core